MVSTIHINGKTSLSQGFGFVLHFTGAVSFNTNLILFLGCQNCGRQKNSIEHKKHCLRRTGSITTQPISLNLSAFNFLCTSGIFFTGLISFFACKGTKQLKIQGACADTEQQQHVLHENARAQWMQWPQLGKSFFTHLHWCTNIFT